MDIALDISDMNSKAVVFNTAVVNGDTLVYPVMIDRIGFYEKKINQNIEKSIVQNSASVTFYFDATNSKGDRPYAEPLEFDPGVNWTLKRGDYVMPVGLNQNYPDVYDVRTYEALLALMEKSEIFQISDVESVRDEMGDIILRSVVCHV